MKQVTRGALARRGREVIAGSFLLLALPGCYALYNPITSSSSSTTSSGGGSGGGGGGGTVVLQCTELPAGSTTYNALGAGTVASPYVICNAAQFRNLAATSAAWGSHFAQRADIDLSGESFATLTPIGNFTTPFTGSYDGENYALQNLTWSFGASTEVGVFGVVFGPNALLKRIRVTHASFDGTGGNAGILAGVVSGGAQVQACFTSGRINSTGQHIGGVVGILGSLGTWHYSRTRLWAHAVVSSSSSSVNVGCAADNTTCSGSSSRGGLVGIAERGAWIIDSFSHGNVDNNAGFTGGLVGLASDSNVLRSYFSGRVNSRTGTPAGSVGGLLGGAYNSRIISTFSAPLELRANIGDSTAGPLLGNNQGGNTLSQNYVVTGGTWNNAGAGGINTTYTGTTATAADLQTLGAGLMASGSANWASGANWANQAGDYPALSPVFFNASAWGSCAAHSADAPFAGGSGTVENPYQICTPAQLAAMDADSTYWAYKAFELRQNLDLTGYSQSAFPIAHAKIANTSPNDRLYFRFNGGGYTISNFTLSGLVEYGNGDLIFEAGLFGKMYASTVHDLTLSNPTLIQVQLSAALSAYAEHSTLRNITITGGSIGSGSQLGSVVRRCENTFAQNISSSASLTSNQSAGGLFGGFNNGLLQNATFTGSIQSNAASQSGGEYAGIAFTALGGMMDQVRSSGTINVTRYRNLSPGFVAGIAASSSSKITRASFTGSIVLETEQSSALYTYWGAGGIIGDAIVGSTPTTKSVLEDSMSTGSISVTENHNGTGSDTTRARIGGLIGHLHGDTSARIRRSYSSGSIAFAYNRAGGSTATTTLHVGGLIGQLD